MQFCADTESRNEVIEGGAAHVDVGEVREGAPGLGSRHIILMPPRLAVQLLSTAKCDPDHATVLPRAGMPTVQLSLPVTRSSRLGGEAKKLRL